jgi:hypothetical protein
VGSYPTMGDVLPVYGLTWGERMPGMHSMGHMASGVSSTFGVLALLVCLAVLVHIFATLWSTRPHHEPPSGAGAYLVHSIPMTLGMAATLTIGTVLGGLLAAHVSTAFLVGLVVGVVVGSLIGLPLGATAIMDGVVAGAMGSLMGIMLGTMVPLGGFYVVSGCLVVLFFVAWAVILPRVW